MRSRTGKLAEFSGNYDVQLTNAENSGVRGVAIDVKGKVDALISQGESIKSAIWQVVSEIADRALAISQMDIAERRHAKIKMLDRLSIRIADELFPGRDEISQRRKQEYLEKLSLRLSENDSMDQVLDDLFTITANARRLKKDIPLKGTVDFAINSYLEMAEGDPEEHIQILSEEEFQVLEFAIKRLLENDMGRILDEVLVDQELPEHASEGLRIVKIDS